MKKTCMRAFPPSKYPLWLHKGTLFHDLSNAESQTFVLSKGNQEHNDVHIIVDL